MRQANSEKGERLFTTGRDGKYHPELLPDQRLFAIRNIGAHKGRSTMAGYTTHIESETIKNPFFRNVLFTGPNSPLVLMSLKPGEEIGMEVHDHEDQFFRIEAGTGKALIDGKEHPLGSGSAVVVPAGARHNIVNTSADRELKLYTIYSPPHHPDRTIHKTRAEAEEAEKGGH
jgi:mannose-6-phosphate isomerase-like protein (cupin superfamily)